MSLSLLEQYLWMQSRRRFLNYAGMGFGAAVLGSLAASRAAAELPELPHFPPRAHRSDTPRPMSSKSQPLLRLPSRSGRVADSRSFKVR